jgi:predicted DNA-binding transcriptional regulator AlpA
MKHARLLPENTEPFGVSREEGAALFGIGTTLFDRMVSDGTIPRPLRIGARTLWDLAALRRSWRRLADQHGEPDINPLDELLHGKVTELHSKVQRSAR